MRNIIYPLLFVLLTPIVSMCQDAHFSCPEQAPLNLNPAMAGANHNMEGMIIYRNQWSSLGDPYKTTAASFHARLNEGMSRQTNQLAIGLQLMNDKAGSPGITKNSASLALSNHIKINQNSKIGAAILLGLGQQSLNTENGEWASQYDGIGFNPAISSGESIPKSSFGFFDIGAGLLYTYQYRQSTLAKNFDKSLNLGIAAYHLNRPNNSFINEGDDRLPIRYSAFINGEYALESFNISISPGIWYQQQAKFSQLLAGAAIKYLIVDETRYTGFNKPLSLSIGLYGRLKDAAIAKLMVDWDRYALGYAYDFNTSGLKDYTKGRGANEIFIRFFIDQNKPARSRGRFS